jgi:hypothetical protein
MNGKIVKSKTQPKQGDTLETMLHDGIVKSTVT